MNIAMDSTIAVLLGLLLFGNFAELAAQRRRVRGGNGSVEFDCPEEFGYYPHPTDCTQYYVCVFGGALLESCTGGLMYSHELQTCDWPRNVGCGAASSSGETLSTVRVTDPRPRGDARSSSRPTTVTLPSREQEQQRRKQEEYNKQQYSLYAEDSRVTPESAAAEEEGPEGGERQQRVYRGQPSTLTPLSRDGLRHAGTVTNSIPASSIGGRGIAAEKGVSYSLVQPLQQQQTQQQHHQQIYSLINEDTADRQTLGDETYEIAFGYENLHGATDVVGSDGLDHAGLLRTKRQISYRFPTGGHLVTAPRPSSYPSRWPPISHSATSPGGFSSKPPPDRQALSSLAPVLRPPTSAPPPRQSLDPPPTTARRPHPSAPSSPTSHRSLGDFLALSGAQLPDAPTGDSSEVSRHQYRIPIPTFDPNKRPYSTSDHIKSYRGHTDPVRQIGAAASALGVPEQKQQPFRQSQGNPSVQFNHEGRNRILLPSGGTARRPEEAQHFQESRQPEVLQDAKNAERPQDLRNVAQDEGDTFRGGENGAAKRPVRIQIPIPNVNSGFEKPILFVGPGSAGSPAVARPAATTRAHPSEQSAVVGLSTASSPPRWPLPQAPGDSGGCAVEPINPGRQSLSAKALCRPTIPPRAPVGPKNHQKQQDGKSKDGTRSGEYASSEQSEEERNGARGKETKEESVERGREGEKEIGYDEEYEEYEEEGEQDPKRRHPDPFYGEHRFGPLFEAHGPGERSDLPKPNFDFELFLERLKEAMGEGGGGEREGDDKRVQNERYPTKTIEDVGPSELSENPFLRPLFGSEQNSDNRGKDGEATRREKQERGENTKQTLAKERENQGIWRGGKDEAEGNRSEVKGHFILQETPTSTQSDVRAIHVPASTPSYEPTTDDATPSQRGEEVTSSSLSPIGEVKQTWKGIRPSARKPEGGGPIAKAPTVDEEIRHPVLLGPPPTRPPPTRPPAPFRPTQRSRLRTTTSATTPKDYSDSKIEGDAAPGDARYDVDAGRQGRTRGAERPVDTSAYADVEVAIDSRPVQLQRARLVSTPATYNATTTTVYTTVAPTAAQPQYDPNYYALYDEEEVELYRDVDYSQVSGGRHTNVGNDNYRGQSHYKVQQQQPEVVQQQSYLTRGNSNSYISTQQQPQQTYVQDVQPDISYGGAALESSDYNDNYNTQVNEQVQYNQASQQQIPSTRAPLNRNRQRVKSTAGTAIRDEVDTSPPSLPPPTRQSLPVTYSTPDSSRRGASRQPEYKEEEVTSSARAELSRRGNLTPRPTQQPRRIPSQPQSVQSRPLPSRLSAAYPISSSSDSSDQPLSQNSIEPFDFPNPSRGRGSIHRESSYTYSNTSDKATIQRARPTSVPPKEKPNVRIRPTTASPESQSTTVSPSRGSASSNNRGRGNSPYSAANASGRSRPTLKPSTAIVSKAAEFIDIYRYPPSRPEPVYPQPRVDQSAAKCRKDICLLPDCNCGGKDVPSGLEPQNVPQMVLLTFDDSVNDLNKQLYSDLFEKGRKNPNGCPISATFYVSHEWTDYSQVQNLYAAGHEMASHSISHSFGEQFSQRKWTREINGQREILAAYGGVKLEDVRGMRAPFLAVGGNKMFKMLYDANFTYDSSMPVYENRPPSWPYTFDYKIFHDCMIPPCPTRSYPGVWEVPMVMWQDLNGGRCSMGDACSNPPTSDGVYKMLIKNFERHYTTNRAPFGLFYHAAWFTQPHHKEGFEAFLDTIVAMDDVWLVTNWQAIQWMRDPTPISHIKQFIPFECNYPDRPRKCNNPKVCNLWHKSGVRYMRTCQPCPDVYPWTGKTGVRNSRVDNEVED